MKAACYVGDKTLSIRDAESRDPESGEVEIAVSYTGICGTYGTGRWTPA